MNMRAIYTFALPHGGDATFYMRSGGYPTGTAIYLLAAHLSDAPTSLADKFYRVNKEVELASDEGRKDLSYHYAIDLNGHLFAYRLESRTDEWDRFFSGHYAEFINGHAPAEALGNGTLKLIKTTRIGACFEWVTRGQLITRHAAAVAALSSHREKYPERADSIASYQNTVTALDLALRQYDEADIPGVAER
ncbi:conserved protein of unknown function [Burkholderia multivorans]